MTFRTLGVSNQIELGLKKENITKPTPIQSAVIKDALEGMDIIGQSITGSGKTLAYLIPIIQKIDIDVKRVQAVILAPTHELVVQINQQVQLLAKNANLAIDSATLIGNVNIKRQLEKLKKKPHIVIGTTGRILELMDMKKLKAHEIKTIVIDEVDRMFDENNFDQVKQIVSKTLRDRQVMAFSASISEDTRLRATELMKTPKNVVINDQLISDTITHYSVYCEQRDKVDTIRKLISATKPERAIIFVNKKNVIERVAAKLQFHHYKVLPLYGEATKHERKQAMDSIRSGKVQVIIASDLAARGLDIKGVTHVFNLDYPENLDVYLHRVGRSGRAGAEGFAFSLVTELEERYLRKLETAYDIEVHPLVIQEGKLWLESE